MKRCPQCLFLYPDSDEKCDFDQTPLEAVDDSALDPATGPAQSQTKQRRTLPVTAVAAGLILGVLVFAIYYAATRQTQKAIPATEAPVAVAPTPSPTAAPSSSPSPVVSPSPSPTSTPIAKTAAANISTAHTRATSDPVSTSGPGIGTRQGVKPVIVLTSGGKIDADEVWRTKDGVWYRRNGIVTLLKRGQVKTISTR